MLENEDDQMLVSPGHQGAEGSRVVIEKFCENCGQPFACGGYGCWCTQVPVSDWQFDWIAARYQDCLCPACLEQVRSGALGSRAANAAPRAPEEGKPSS